MAIPPRVPCHVTNKMALRKLQDVFGQDVSLSDPEALPLFNEGVHLLVSSYGVPMSYLEKAITKDKDFLMAQLVAVSGMASCMVCCACTLLAVSARVMLAIN